MRAPPVHQPPPSPWPSRAPSTSSTAPAEPPVTDLLDRWVRGEPGALDRLLPTVLDSLHELAERHLARQRGLHSLQPTALVHEAYLRLVGSEVRGFENRRCFFAFASQLIRRVLVDRARSRTSEKRGGRYEVRALDGADESLPARLPDMERILAVHECLERLEKLDPRQSRIAELRYFAGLTVPEIGQTLGLSTATVERLWRLARRRLALELGRSRERATQEGP